MTAMLDVQNLVMRFPLSGTGKVVQAVNDVSFTIDRGETLALVGESGSGKTTVGRCILGLIDATRGQVWFDGESVACPVYQRDRVDVGVTLKGPAILDQFDCTTVVLPGQTARVDALKNLIVTEASP